MPELFVDLAIPVAVDALFTYRVPAELQAAVKRGVRAIAPFGKRTVIGIIVNSSPHPPAIRGLKSIADILDAEPVLSEDLLKLTEWMGRYYFAPWGEVLRAALVQGTTAPGKRIVRLTGSDIAALKLTPNQKAILSVLAERDARTISQLQKELRVRSIYTTLADLAQKNALIIEEKLPVSSARPKVERVIIISDIWKDRWRKRLEERGHTELAVRQNLILHDLIDLNEDYIPVPSYLKASRRSLSSVRTLEKKGLLSIIQRETIRSSSVGENFSEPAGNTITLNPHQQKAFDIVRESLEKEEFVTYLLHGITGSGKTQVYIEAIRVALSMHKTAIVLVPEISLTPQTVHRFRVHFGEQVVSLHSRMSIGERYDAWRMIRDRKYSVVIGPRSAVFAPLGNLGLIVVDEEHEASFKQFDQSPRYHARDVAIMRASISGAVVLLGSATPSIESYQNAINGKYTLLELPERVDTAKLPRIDIVDMTAERQKKLSAFREERKAQFKEDYKKAKADTRKLEFGLISDLLKEQITDRLRKKEGIILLQNRRGFAPIIECPACGYVAMCENCNISLTYHLTKKHCRCHYCGFVAPPPEKCPTCHSDEIKFRGFGTQRIEEELLELFPGVSLLRMDLDTTTTKGSHHRILQKFSEGEVDILLGTQMVAKGLDFPRVTLVGVISADTQMLLPDFRSAERTFQLLTQVAGRAGRSTLAGEVVIQTFQPSHYALKHVLNHDFRSFFVEELAYRQELFYPPFSRLAVIECRGESEPDVMKHALFIGGLLKAQRTGLIILGPAPAAITKINNRYRWHIVIKELKSSDRAGKQLHRSLTAALHQYRVSPIGKKRDVEVLIDIDPGGMM